MIASRLQIVLHLQDSYWACPKMAESIGQLERGRELMQGSSDASRTVETQAANDTQGTSIGLRCRRKSYSIDTQMKVLAKYEQLGQHICIKFAPLLLYVMRLETSTTLPHLNWHASIPQLYWHLVNSTFVLVLYTKKYGTSIQM